MATIKDIALNSGVAASTVSEVLNYKPRAKKVSEATKKRIFEAARKLNYTPNIVARGLRTGRSMQIGLLIDRIEGSIFPYIIQGIEDVLYARGYSGTFYIYRSEQDLVERARLLKQKQVDGILLYPDECIPSETFQTLLKDYPVVTFAKKLQNSSIPCVKVNGEKIGYLATKYLFELGHSKIAFFCIKGKSREKGCRKALNELGISEDRVEFLYLPHGFEEGRKAFREILEMPEVSAVYAYSDHCAAGMVYEANLMGIKIPDRLSIVGCNNLPISSQVYPPITTINQPKSEQGSEAARMLLDMIENKSIGYDKLLAPDLIERQSVKSVK